MRLAALLLLLLLLVPGARAQEVEHVLVVFLDGPRYRECFGEPFRIPRIWGELRPAGSILTGFRNLGVTATVPGHSSSTTGRWQDLANDGSERPHDPTLFERMRAAAPWPAESGWVVAGKSKLDVLAHSDHPDFGAAYAGRDTVGMGSDPATHAVLLGTLAQWHPRLTVVNFPSIDGAGHSGDWDAYLAAIAAADALVGDLWEFVEADPQLTGRTALFVTADHGRHDNLPLLPHDGFTSHGDDCNGCQHLPFLALGAGIRSAVESAIPRSQVDLAATVAFLLGLGTETMVGRPMWEILENVPVARTVPAGGARLGRVYPNPFNPALSVELRSEDEEFASLIVYDPRGRRVRVLYSGSLGVGTTRLRWDGRDDRGGSVASGVYHLRLLTDDGVQQRPLLLVR